MILLQVKGFMGDVDDIIHWLSDFRNGMKSGPMGALPETAQKQFDKYLVSCQDYEYVMELSRL
jgi:hypothetical protein